MLLSPGSRLIFEDQTKAHFYGLNLCTAAPSRQKKNHFFLVTGGRLYTVYLPICKLDGENVAAIIESSKHGCRVRKPYNLGIFLLVFFTHIFNFNVLLFCFEKRGNQRTTKTEQRCSEGIIVNNNNNNNNTKINFYYYFFRLSKIKKNRQFY